MIELYCDEHGHMANRGAFTAPAGIEVIATSFCPLCQRELFPRDPLTEIERQGKPAATFEEWLARQDMDVLDFGTIAPGDDA